MRRALTEEDPETRRAAVLVAAGHGLRRYARLLSSTTRTERSERVLLTLADVVRTRGCPGRGASKRLRQWSEAFLRDAEPSRRAPRRRSAEPCSDERPSAEPRSEEEQLPPVVDLIDPLDLEQVAPVDGAPALDPPRADLSLLPAPVWTAAPGQLDALAVLASLADNAAPKSTRTPPPPRNGDSAPPANGHGTRSARRWDHDALVDQLAGVAPRRLAPPGGGSTRLRPRSRPRVSPEPASSRPRRSPPPRTPGPTPASAVRSRSDVSGQG